MKDTTTLSNRSARLGVLAGVAATALPGTAWTHPGHGLDGLWVHDVLHGVTAMLAITLVTLLTVGVVRHRRHRKRD
ncbi:MAG: hypothetical protein CMQ34_13155 [Gammaproteobacteria bacterium]|nr:hypothetical protein [Gammaproteobacteria bacterium]